MEIQSCFAGPESLTKILSLWRGANAEVLPIADKKGRLLGNHGDAMMQGAFRHLLNVLGIRAQAPFESEQPDLVILPPSGALLEDYTAPDLVKQILRPYANTPLVIFPSSANFPTRDPSFLFEGRTATTLWILREDRSHDQLRSLWGKRLANRGVSLAVDHDVVVSGHQYVATVLKGFSQISADHATTLLVSRLGAEAGDFFGARKQVSLVRSVATNIYQRLPSCVPLMRLRREINFATPRGGKPLAMAPIERRDTVQVG